MSVPQIVGHSVSVEAKLELRSQFDSFLNLFFQNDTKTCKIVFGIVRRCIRRTFEQRGTISEDCMRQYKSGKKIDAGNTTTAKPWAKRRQKHKGNEVTESSVHQLSLGVVEEIWSYFFERIVSCQFEINDEGLLVFRSKLANSRKEWSGNSSQALIRLLFASVYDAINEHKREQYHQAKNSGEDISSACSVSVKSIIDGTTIEQVVEALLPDIPAPKKHIETIKERNKRLKKNRQKKLMRENYVERLNWILIERGKGRLSDADQRFLSRFRGIVVDSLDISDFI